MANNAKKVGEGGRLREEIERREISKEDFAEACGITGQALQRHLKAPKLKAGAWETVSHGLDKFEIPYTAIRPESNDHGGAVVDLFALMEDFKPECLETVFKILWANQASRERLKNQIDGALRMARSQRKLSPSLNTNTHVRNDEVAEHIEDAIQRTSQQPGQQPAKLSSRTSHGTRKPHG